MNYEDRVVCFVDILGFKSIIAETVEGENDVPEKIEKLSQALDLMKYFVDRSDEGSTSSHKVTQFSDCFVISFHEAEPGQRLFTICSLLWVFINLALRGILIRGGIAVGKIIHTDKVVFGPAMNEAYRLENEVAVNPRVVVSPDVIAGIVHVGGDPWDRESEQELIKSCLAKDSDGHFYVDYIRKAQSELDDPENDLPIYLKSLRDIARSGLDSPDLSVRAKYEWLNDKVQPYLTELLEWAEKHADDPDMLDAYRALANG